MPVVSSNDISRRVIEDEKRLVARILGGDRESFRQIVEEHQNMVYSILVRGLRDKEAARDLTQEVFLRAFRGLSNFKGESQFSTWLTRITLNVMNSFFVSRSFRDSKRSEPYVADNELAASLDCAKEDELRALEDAIAELPELYRIPLLLCSLEGRSYEESAVILQIPVGTVRSRLNTARNLLRKKLFT